jgi:hypothetical protein
LDSAEVTGEKSFTFVNGATGQQSIFWPETLGKPKVITTNNENTITNIRRIESG